MDVTDAMEMDDTESVDDDREHRVRVLSLVALALLLVDEDDDGRFDGAAAHCRRVTAEDIDAAHAGVPLVAPAPTVSRAITKAAGHPEWFRKRLRDATYV